ncbi:B12-binding domain-containing protein [Bacillus sp. PS06]|uniref:cobalamin B12-binding domain-containing protein n=1 Tax=Bacillus sp. PS06 TaxID=2764176 RepID=UPI001780532B|nr:cobalamin-dependent protein [Bacillus sp. PS06]MBD8070155.1 cobalamin B12-binding domain-containing protein [Bacillus sp. PS06]
MQDKLIVRKLAHFLLQGDEINSWNLLSEYQAKGNDLTSIYEVLLTGAMRYIGELWEENEITVADEHIASNVCSFLVSKLIFENKSEQFPNSGKAMLFCVEGEEHSLGIKMVNNLFKELNWDTRFLGANLPNNEAFIYANQWQPDVICISASIVYNLPNLVQLLQQLDLLDYQPEIIVGGRITTLYSLEQYCSNKPVVIEEINDLKEWLLKYRLCSNQYVTS